jgi:hypothetical protein
VTMMQLRGLGLVPPAGTTVFDSNGHLLVRAPFAWISDRLACAGIIVAMTPQGMLDGIVRLMQMRGFDPAMLTEDDASSPWAFDSDVDSVIMGQGAANLLHSCTPASTGMSTTMKVGLAVGGAAAVFLLWRASKRGQLAGLAFSEEEHTARANDALEDAKRTVRNYGKNDPSALLSAYRSYVVAGTHAQSSGDGMWSLQIQDDELEIGRALRSKLGI